MLHKNVSSFSNLMPQMTFHPQQKSDHSSQRELASEQTLEMKEGLNLLPILGNDSEINVEVKKSRW